ncbi:multidrug resistance-associated protein 6 [Gaeumannomyces tritici R3-111a-1]|uniref:Multidrug resistance-associated protein 6 n=1 Tax=Gaeumannomyces tritici (strain R3-111a-1) TaxID=644352 RepID=J3PGP4_GAET3|nr:multidrug resistance-associated protein 6 [Gaeumannomyces tritici R3-111a-1]EJT69790.1 multidrug resistance-associated protein 6 [Gaeumannomyces tritici R3-111a-1]
MKLLFGSSAMEGAHPSWQNLLPCYSCCQRIWISEQAAFGKHCTGIISQIPVYISLLVLLSRYALFPLWNRRPSWLHSFAAESDELPTETGDTASFSPLPSAGVPTNRSVRVTNGHHVNGAADDNADSDDGVFCPPKFKSWNRHSLTLLLLSALSAGSGSVAASIYNNHDWVLVMSAMPSMATAAILAVERPQTAPGGVFLIQSGLLLTQLALLLGVPSLAASWDSLILFLITVFITLGSVVIILMMPLRDPRMPGTGEVAVVNQEPTSTLRSPEDNFTVWDWMTVSWMSKLIAIGYRRQVQPEDVWLLPYEFQHRRLHLLFRQIRGSVIGRILSANAPDLIIISVLGIFESTASIGQVVLLKQLLGALDTPTGEGGDGEDGTGGGLGNVRVAMAYAVVALFLRLAAAQSAVFSLWFSRRCYERSRGEMITMIYEKTIRRKAFTFPGVNQRRDDEEEDVDGNQEHAEGQNGTNGSAGANLSPEEAQKDAPASMGKILNLMRNDVYEVAQRFWEFPSLFTKPLNFVLSLVLIWNLLGPSSLLGILAIVLAQGVNAMLIRGLLGLERTRRKISDIKLQVTSQFVETIRHLRWYDWQDRWLKEILEMRNLELRYRVLSNLLQKALNVLGTLAALALPLASFYAYTVISGKPLSVDIAFPALNLFATLNTTLTELPFLAMMLVNASVAMGRIESFMAEPDKEDAGREDQHHDANGDARPPGELKLAISDASFSWPGYTDKRHVLRDVCMECGPGLTVVCGKVGAGKTALLQAILGELDQQPGGQRQVPDEMAGYCAQTPWLQSMSIRENILFSEPYDPDRYRRTLEACALLPDLKEFEGGDLSMVGENGVGLSGGQKARVALARAVYSRARVLLLDDPIAALDHHTAEHVVRKLFSSGGLCEGRLVVLVTHRVDLIRPWADQIYEVFADRASSLEKHRPDELDTDAEFHRRVAAEEAAEEAALQQQEEEGAADHGNAAQAIPDKFIQEEHRAHGGVMVSVYWRYVKAGRLWLWVLLMILFAAHRFSNIVYFYFLKVWGEAYKQGGNGTSAAARAMFVRAHLYGMSPVPGQATLLLKSDLPNTFASVDTSNAGSSRLGGGGWIDDIRFGLPPPQDDVQPWLYWFLMLSMAQAVAELFSDLTLVAIVYSAGKRLFEDVMRRVAAATFRFYDVTPVGRLMNRLTSDISTIDGSLAGQLHQVAFHSIAWVSAVGVIAATTPTFLALAVGMTGAFVYIFKRFLPLSQSLRRLEMVSLSPLMSNFGTLLEGLTTVRAFRAQRHFEHRIVVTTDAFQQMDHFYWSLQSWLAYRFDALSALSTFALTATALWSGLSPGAVAFVLAAAATFVETTHVLCRKYGELQMMFVSVERVVELLDLETEPEVGSGGGGGGSPGRDGGATGRGGASSSLSLRTLDTTAAAPPLPLTRPPASWPTARDDIVFDRVTLRYAPDLEPSLRDVSFRIPAGSTVAVTGRTGSGKSTLALALLGTILPDRALEDDAPYSDDVAAENGDGAQGRGGGVGRVASSNDLLDLGQDDTTTVARSNGEHGANGSSSSGHVPSQSGAVVASGRTRRANDGSGSGSIWIGDVDIARVDKHALRRRVSFVAQDPVLFPGTLRENLDPLGDYTDVECELVLSRVLGSAAATDDNSGDNSGAAAAAAAAAASREQATSSSEAQTATFSPPPPPRRRPLRLGTRVDGGGRNLSQGQRQLVGIARAVLRRSPLVILDEATASIDVATARRLQAVLRSELGGSTVVTIAHRAEAVRDADFALELDRGRVVRAERIGRAATTDF